MQQQIKEASFVDVVDIYLPAALQKLRQAGLYNSVAVSASIQTVGQFRKEADDERHVYTIPIGGKRVDIVGITNSVTESPIEDILSKQADFAEHRELIATIPQQSLIGPDATFWVYQHRANRDVRTALEDAVTTLRSSLDRAGLSTPTVYIIDPRLPGGE